MLGIQDDRLVHTGQDPAPRFEMIADQRAKLVRVDMRWDMVAPAQPANPRDPADPAYVWGVYDGIVKAASERGIEVMFAVWGTPSWSRDTSPDAAGGPAYEAWPFGAKPRNPADAGAFAEAAARRYAPKGVHRWEAWNEPNGPIFLRPQFRRESGRWVPESPRIYAAILKAMYAGFHAGDPKAVVAGGVTAPAGEVSYQTSKRQPNARMQPHHFIEALNAEGLRPPMDAYAHHPYPLRAPSDTVDRTRSYVDLYNLPVLTDALDAGYLKDVPLWLTEFGVSTRSTKQYTFSRTEDEQRSQLEDGLKRVRANPRVKMLIWYFLQDHPDWASGLIREDGSAKPAAAVFAAAGG